MTLEYSDCFYHDPKKIPIPQKGMGHDLDADFDYPISS